MAAWRTDDEYMSAQAASSLPTPQGTLYRTPSQTSRKSQAPKRSRRSATPPGKGTSPSRMVHGDKSSKRSSRDVTTDENISILDPRRFTPTLHANLVSEILALRRDQEEKTKLIESLESVVQTSREEQETLQESVTATSKENRSLQRQLSLLEGGTSSALGELCRERDEAVGSVADARRRLETAQKTIRSQEEDSQRVHDIWAQEKDNWEDEKRKYERRIHVAESRLKVVLDEVAQYQDNQANRVAQNGRNSYNSDPEESGRENDAASIRTMSITNSIRFSVNGAGSALYGHCLADELNFDDTDDQTDVDGRESVLSSPRHRRTFSRGSVASRTHRRNQSMESLKRPCSVARGRLFKSQAVLETLEGEDEEMEASIPAPAVSPKPPYTTTGTQCTPPPSPKLEPVTPVTPDPPLQMEKVPELESSPRPGTEIEANQRRKRVSLPLPIEHPTVYRRMVSSAVQTLESPLSPPKMLKPPNYHSVSTTTRAEPPRMATISTQTEEQALAPVPNCVVAPAYRQPPSPPLDIPSISIQPPTSRPTTPLSPRLPQHFKHFGCQVNLTDKPTTANSCSQTNAIQTDRRLALLPPHLQPSSISSRPTSPNPSGVAMADKHFTPVPGNLPPRNPRRLEGSRNSNDLPSSPLSMPTEDDDLLGGYHGNQNGPLSSRRSAHTKRLRRYSSFYSGFYSSDEMDEFVDVELSDAEYQTALSAPRPPSTSSRPVKRPSLGTVAMSTEGAKFRRSIRNSAKLASIEPYSPHSPGDKEFAKLEKLTKSYQKPIAGPSSRASVMRKAAMIQNDIASHQSQSRSRSPSLIDPANPPFPIPTRASSRKPSISISIPSDGHNTPTRDGGHRRSGSQSHVRRVCSANAVPRNHRHRRHGSRSPPLTPSTEAPESPGLPPLPRKNITTPHNPLHNSVFRGHRHEHSVNTEITNNTETTSRAGASQVPGVVEAIAQAMVGEWMFKYVRRRKSFGVTDSNRDDTSNDRHKRWVWLAPYERAILWSSKQPSSGNALLGKTGRKLAIQSVLDVKDDNLPPKGVTTPVFNRSILILTPQRALKFTATTLERHYLWLTALSFLAHSSQAVPDIPAPLHLSMKQQPLPNFELPAPKIRRGGIRDSIRLAKGRTAATKTAQTHLPSVPDIPSASQMSEIGSSRAAEQSVVGSHHTREASRDAAEPPRIPRFHDRISHVVAHSRKRTNTGGHINPPLSFRGVAGPFGTGSDRSANSTTNAGTGTADVSDIYQPQGSTNTSSGLTQTLASTAPPQPGNFFDAIGTVRMEAFISPLASSQTGEAVEGEEDIRHLARRRSKEVRRRSSRNRRRHIFRSKTGRRYGNQFGGAKASTEDFFRDDPFRGF